MSPTDSPRQSRPPWRQAQSWKRRSCPSRRSVGRQWRRSHWVPCSVLSPAPAGSSWFAHAAAVQRDPGNSPCGVGGDFQLTTPAELGRLARCRGPGQPCPSCHVSTRTSAQATRRSGCACHARAPHTRPLARRCKGLSVEVDWSPSRPPVSRPGCTLACLQEGRLGDADCRFRGTRGVDACAFGHRPCQNNGHCRSPLVNTDGTSCARHAQH